MPYAPRSAVSVPECRECGRLFVARRAARPGVPATCRDEECQRLTKNRQQRDYLSTYKARHGARYEDRYEGRKILGRERRRRDPEGARRNDEIRRARKVGATVEVFDASEVFDRDGWVCGLCREPVVRELRWPDPGSASLDHVVPLSLGGAHSRENTRIAHLSCNVRRGAARGETSAVA